METFPTRPLQLIPRYFSPVLRETGSVKTDSALEELCRAKCVRCSHRPGHLEACGGAGFDVLPTALDVLRQQGKEADALFPS